MKIEQFLQDPGAWVAIGISLLFIVAGLVMHRVIVRVLKSPPTPDSLSPSDASSDSQRTEHP